MSSALSIRQLTKTYGNGFQALIKTGLVPYGEIRDVDASAPTLFHNRIARHISRYAHTRIASVKSPWLSRMEVGQVHTIPLSHGEGRFTWWHRAADDHNTKTLHRAGFRRMLNDRGEPRRITCPVGPDRPCVARAPVAKVEWQPSGSPPTCPA